MKQTVSHLYTIRHASHQLGGTVRNSISYNFEDQVTQTLQENSTPTNLKVYRSFEYAVNGALARIRHGINGGTPKILSEFGYNDLGQQTSKSFPGAAASTQTYTYNIRGWLTALGSNTAQVYKQHLFYNSGATTNKWNGNISRINWSGQDGVLRTYNYTYDKANRLLTAPYTVASATAENTRYSISGITYDNNGNIQTMTRRVNRRPALPIAI